MIIPEHPERIEISLDISPELYQTLQTIAKEINGDPAEVLLKGIILMQIVVAAKKEDKYLWITDKNSNLETQIIGI